MNKQQTLKKLHIILFQTAYTSVTRILREASQILENGHYAAGHVRSVANRLETTWKELATIFDERSSVLTLSAVFHQKAEQYVENVPKWNTVIGFLNDT